MEAKKNDPRAVRTRNVIQEAFVSLIIEKNFDKITVKDVAKRAGINRVTFYAYFNDKFDLLEDMVCKEFTKFISVRIQQESELNPNSCKGLIQATYDCHKMLYYDCKLGKKPVADLINNQIIKVLQSAILAKMAQNRCIVKDNPELAAVLAAHAIYGTADYYNTVKDNKKELHTLLEEITSFVMRGILSAAI